MRTAERAFGLGLLMLDQVLEAYDVRCPKRVPADPLTRRALDPDDPTLPAYLDRDVQRVVLRTDRRDDVATSLSANVSETPIPRGITVGR